MIGPTKGTLLERLRDPLDGMAWEEFARTYTASIYAYARHRGCSPHTADEVVQDVMLVVFEKRDVFRYDPAQGRFRDWLMALVRNQLGQRRRRPSERVKPIGGQRPAGAEEPEDPGNPPDRNWELFFEQALLAAILDVVRREMNPQTYQAFELVVLNELSGAEAARITGLSRNAVYLARRRVVKRLEELGEPYRRRGELGRRLREAMDAHPDAEVERSALERIEHTLSHSGEAGK
ncbi:MAG: sigma-70 family RNA polymerase sigma factor [Rhodopirellula sp.]|nr:sigma-70 family RNA polymerase sigma factor [Rhodopirellula sp.]